MTSHHKYTLLAHCLFWPVLFMTFGWLCLLKAAMAAIVIVAWGFVSVGIATWLGDRTFGKM